MTAPVPLARGELTDGVRQAVAQVHARRGGARPAGDQAEAHPRLRPEEPLHGILDRVRGAFRLQRPPVRRSQARPAAAAPSDPVT